MTLFAMLFPGQGSQYVGMLSSFLYKNNVFKDTFNEASHYVQYNLMKLIENGPKEKLNRSKYAQITILTASVAMYRLWKSLNGKSPKYMSGHSLGEYSALVCSKSINFSDALRIVLLRGEMMETVTINRPCLMQAIIGIDKKIVQKACEMVLKKKKIVSLASINSYDQTIISGDKSAVFQTGLYCKKFGAKHVLKLNVDIPAHCQILKPIAQKLKKILNHIHIKSPKIPVINNIDVKSENKTKNIKQALIKQIYNTVRWEEIIKSIELKKIFIMLEIGPNKILTSLNKKNEHIVSFSTHNLESFLRAFQQINEK